MTDVFGRLINRIAQLEAQIVDLSRRMNNVMREAEVVEVDHANALAIVKGQNGKSKPAPWLQRSGSIRDWDPPTPGERVIMLSPGGDPGRAMILPGGYSEAYPAPHNAGGEAMRVIGSSSDLTTGSSRVIEAQLIILRGTVQIEGDLLTHNGKDVGHTHKHGGVQPGGGITSVPI